MSDQDAERIARDYEGQVYRLQRLNAELQRGQRMDTANTTSSVSAAVQSFTRTLVISIAGYYAARGVIDNDMAQALGAAVPAVLAGLWGIWNAWRSEHKTQQREQIAVQAGVAASQTGEMKHTMPENISMSHAQGIIDTYAPPKE